MERVLSGEVSIREFEKFSSKVNFNFCVNWGVKPDNCFWFFLYSFVGFSDSNFAM